MKKGILTLAALFFGACAAWAQTIEPYIPSEQMPDVVKIVPAPPADPSPEFQRDMARAQQEFRRLTSCR